MTALRHIRCTILHLTQAELAQVVGTTQATVSRWERGELEPSLSELASIRAYAKGRGCAWSDAWFFDHALTGASGEGIGAAVSGE